MHPTSRSNRSALRRVAPLAVLALALSAASGCGWFRAESGYKNSPESRPLEVPPDLDAPQIDPTMSVPDVPNVTRSTAAIAAASAPFVVADASDSVWRRVGLALERIEGVEITDRAQLLSAYGVRFAGEEFLIRITAEGEGSRISAATAAGAESSSAASQRLLGLLKQRIG